MSETPKPQPVEKCDGCATPLSKGMDGQLRYHSTIGSYNVDGWPISVRLCADCWAEKKREDAARLEAVNRRNLPEWVEETK